MENHGDVAGDIFDSIVMAPERRQVQGHEEGFERGRRQGLVEGWQLGVKHGGAIAAEVAFYYGFTVTWQSLLQRGGESDVKSSRKLKALEALSLLIRSCPIQDATHPELQENLDKIRAKFKQARSQLTAPCYKAQLLCRCSTTYD
ncbi:protein LTO1 homolog isoform X1 [Lethenteron reissneri]|uniref:protein LTO1 homolog isoform X1 n=1 Tax=Lethenteron reissneri TaxID=7753 RepID=UPI002AB5E559|nr:protein LTO1 homolog isoform X1 [Lethenteron reissneri]